jgi:predicted polyphosphate/ATP-dependent NAD kinase
MSGGVVGIIANPASGKDIRRVVGHAATVDNQGKVGIIRRALVGLGAVGVRRVLIMPDDYRLGERALDGLSREALPCVEMVDMPVRGDAVDSERAAAQMQKAGARCIIVLGGDGTTRVVSKGAGDVPLLAISTGTNNVLPEFIEGTVAGMAAGALATGWVARDDVAVRSKWLEIALSAQDGSPPIDDVALVDVALLAGRFVGARAIWNAADIKYVVVTRAHPAGTGISALAGWICTIDADEPAGLALTLDPGESRRVLAPLGPGLLSEVGIGEARTLMPGEMLEMIAEEPLLLALDGEREHALRPGDRVCITLRLDGPWLVDARRAVEALAARGFVRRPGVSQNTKAIQ